MDNASPSTEQPTPPTGGSGPRVTRDEMKDLGRLRRSVTDRHIAGVAGGLARHFDIDPIIVRVALVVAVFFGGAGLLVYIGAWLLVPEEGTADEPLGLDQRSRTLALGGIGVLALLAAVGDWAGAFWFPWPLAIIAALVIWHLNRKQKATPPTGGYGYGYSAPPAAPGMPATTAGSTAGSTATAAPAYDATGEQVVDPPYAYDPQPAHQPQPGWAPPATYAPGPRLPRNPRKRGPILFLFTLALIALAEGVLGVVDLAGAPVADSAYPALALGTIAVMLLVGAFWGRAGGLIALGLVAALATAGATASDNFHAGDRTYAPTSATQVRESYDFGGGRFLLDLSDVSDVDNLDGHEIAIDGVGGRVEVVVPEGMDVDVTAQVVGGDIRIFDQRDGGFDVTQTGSLDGGVGVPDMSINIDLVGGEVIVREAA